ncbi:MAG: Stp1/IreP family PP2C-type Ser/Thr phosphatase [Deltaproteobacteria bacterium]|nr:Stp1/IreP family PP2C-type Ser/Thr phosphatase [Deltaproteobacteria bacterium]MBI2500580.1 Stp1/IreP family PP2C-type Ser/Thr phosphatase [Deltaproteobacteria bacterium]MBI4196213.1 Stp1/IreP family PP2C-type Ser/Thr phosphatase [Deltaproteobacteria bacterium]
MKIVSFGKSDVGKKREKNEDSFLVDESIGLYVVADGMGGHLGGEYASKIAVKTIQEILRKFRDEPEAMMAEGHSKAGDPVLELKQAIRIASQRIYKEAIREPNLRGMGTTVVALLIRDQKGYLANVGDSRGYLIRNPEIQQLTVDHSLVSEQLQAGFITLEEVKHHRLKNIITRSVGFQEDVETDLVVRELEEGDQFLLCSDGLTNLVPDDEIQKLVSKGKSSNPKSACEKLIQLANQRGGDDNVTTVIVSVQP